MFNGFMVEGILSRTKHSTFDYVKLRTRQKVNKQNVGQVGLNSSGKLDTECIKM